MKIVRAHLESISFYSQSKHYTPKPDRETAKDYEARTWRERCHTTNDGHIYIPPMAFKNCLSEAAKFLAMQIPGKGKSTYTKHFEAGILVLDELTLPILKDEVEGEWLFVPSDGRRGSGSRVEKCFPLIRSWAGIVTFHVADPVISKEVFEKHLNTAGTLIGIGRFRPRNNGYYGRFRVKLFEYEGDWTPTPEADVARPRKKPRKEEAA